MTMVKLEVHCSDEHWIGDEADEVEVEITDDLRDMVRPAVHYLSANKQYWKVVAFDYRCEWGVRTEAEEIHITDHDVYWTALIKHTNIELFTEALPLLKLLN